ncbi:hypothetical protein ACWD7Y_22690 [Streptomyces drozdowiczii]
MISHTGTLFNDGPLRRVVEAAVRARESQGALDLDDEVRRFVRTAGAADSSRWVLPVVAVAALLDHTADLLRSEGVAFFPREFTERLDKARDDVPGEEFLRTLAGRVRMADQELDAGFDELPLADWEAAARFPELLGFGPNWIYDGEFPLLSEAQVAFRSPGPGSRGASFGTALFPLSCVRGGGSARVLGLGNPASGFGVRGSSAVVQPVGKRRGVGKTFPPSPPRYGEQV